MSETLERLLSRLENLEAIEPLVSSMRILSLSTVQFAMNRREFLETYESEYLQIAAQLAALKKDSPRPLFRRKKSGETAPVATGRKLLIVLGSDRGIVGQYNRQLSSMAERWAAENPQGQVQSFGTRLISTMSQLLNIPFVRGGTLVKGYSPDYERIPALIAEWQQAVDSGDPEAVEVLSFRNTRGNTYRPMVTPWLPLTDTFLQPQPQTEIWPLPILEEDPALLMERIRAHMATLTFYIMLFEAIAAENTSRYARLEEAKENLESLLAELSLEIQISKRQAVTSQIQEIAVAAGLVK